jgi:SpoVK/Ycf46/Vps4 family AAA+-type ATPase
MPEAATDNKRAADKLAAYANNWEHLSDELRCLDLRIRLQALKQRNGQPLTNSEQFKGLALSEEEINGLLNNDGTPFEDKGSLSPDDPEICQLTETLNQFSSEIQERRAASLKGGIYLSLPHLSHLFHLTLFEEQCLLICLAPELDIKYEKLYAYVQDDITRKRSSVDMVLNLLCYTMQEKLSARLVFDPQAPLLKYKLLQMADGSQDSSTPLISRFLKIDNRIVNFLLGFGQMDSRLESIARLVPAQAEPKQTTVSEDIQNRIKKFIHFYLSKEKSVRRNIIFHFHGHYGAGKEALAYNICQDIGLPLLIVDTEKITGGQTPFENITSLLGREAILQQAALCFKNFDHLLTDDEKHQFQLRLLLEALRTFSPLTFLLSSRSWKPQGSLKGDIFIEQEFSIPDYESRKGLWKNCLNSHYTLAGDVDLNTLANKFRFTQGQIHDAINMAQNLACWRSPNDVEITMTDLYTACRAQSNFKLSALAHKIKAKYIWNDIVLPLDQKNQLREICNHVKYRHIVYGEWGFDRKLSLGMGLNVLFSGPPGTGKTMAAEVIANELKLDIYKIDLSQVVSKYIGETEKNLNKIFSEAQTSNAILFFDEADALFGKRSEVKDAHDRYANIEIGYLLQKMEEYDGIVILATNLRNNMDEAFARRIQFTIEFPFPDERERKLMWQGIFPENTPLAKDIDYDFLSEKLKITGGNIKNIALTSAFYAAKQAPEIEMSHIMLAAKREYQKIGKPFLKSDLGHYYKLTEEK